ASRRSLTSGVMPGWRLRRPVPRRGRARRGKPATRSNAGPIRRSWSDFGWTGTGSCWRSAASRGNHAETRTIVSIIQQFQARHNLADTVVVADAGRLSMTDLTALDEGRA